MRDRRSLLLRLVLVLFAVMLVAAACGDDDEGDEGSGDTSTTAAEGGEASADFETISEGTLTVCSDAPYEPFEFQDDSGEWTGFDMDLMREIATRIGDLDLEVTVQPFDGIWLAPAAGTCDIVASAMTITEERSANALFSDPYYDSGQSLLVRAEDESTITDLEALADGRIGVQTGTTGAEYATENKPEGAEVVEFEDAPGLFAALQSGDIDAILQDLPVNAYRAQQEPDTFALVGDFPTDEQYGFAAAQDSTALIEAVNDALAEMRDDGTYDEIYAKYFAG